MNFRMFIGKTRLPITFLTLALGMAGPAAALGFGQLRANPLLGHALEVALPVSLAEGETLTSECATAEVQSGESRLPPDAVRVRVTRGRDANEAILRISTTVAIDEPIVNLTVSAGCPTRITRTMVLLADPPLVNMAAAPAPPPAVPAPPPAAPAPVAEAARSDAGASAAPMPAPRATRPSTPTRPARAATPRPQRNVAAAPAPEVAPSQRSRPRAAAAAPKPPAAEGRPRLQLDSAQVAVATPELLAAQAQLAAARETAAVAEAAASAAQLRLKAVEAEVAQLRADAKAQTEALVELRKQIAADRNRPMEASWLMPALLALVALLGATALWLMYRLRQQQRQAVIQRQAWYERERAAPTPSISPSSSVAGDEDDSDYQGFSASRIPDTMPPSPAVAPRATLSPPSMFDTRGGGLDSMISPPTMPAHTAVTLPLSGQRAEDESLRAMSVDEQIDLEQQADFFIALGHDESAIDLLMAHLRSTGGSTPLPFLKLLEIHGRRGDREAYERTRVRFNQRFNSVAPEWQADPKAGRSLEDYPLVVGRIQSAWPTPLDAMAELEALLFRRGAGSEMFELPAYQEVLFLYQLARDLHQASPAGTSTDVDVLLPISAPAPPLAEGEISLRPEFNSGQALTLDLDLGGAKSAASDGPIVELDLGPDDGTAEPGGGRDGGPLDKPKR
jgi:hypothetical protein